jgi:hypothetical protein
VANEAYVQVNKPATLGVKLATYEFENDNGDDVQSEAVTLTDSAGDELLGVKPSAESLPVVLASDQAAIPVEITSPTSTLNNGAETPITSAAAVAILAANPSRKQAIIQNTGAANIRVGVAGVTATTGLRLTPNAVYTYTNPNIYQGALYAIAEAASSVAFAQEAD